MNKKPISKKVVLLIVLYFMSRAIIYSTGITFDSYSDTHIMQLPPFELLATSPLETLWYMHIQPPIYALIFYLCGMDSYVFALFYFFLGLATTIGMYKLIEGFEVNRYVAFIIAFLFSISPSFILYQNLMFYTFLVMSLLIFAALALQRGKVFTFSIILMLLCLTRSIFHPVWMGVSLWIALSKRL